MRWDREVCIVCSIVLKARLRVEMRSTGCRGSFSMLLCGGELSVCLRAATFGS